MKIRYIKHQQIDHGKWDRAIDNSIAPLIYAYAWYLDGITGRQWDGLVYGDYEAVFPLPWKRKYFLKYIYQPYFCQQLGMFAKKGFRLSNADFIRKIPKVFILIDLQLNLYAGNNNLEGRLKNNYRLDLNVPYAELYKNYSQDVRNNLKKIEKSGVKFVIDISLDKVIEINRNAWGEMNPGIREHHYQQFRDNCVRAKERGALLTIGAMLDNELIGAALLFKTPGNLFYVISGKTDIGKRTGIMNGIVNKVIEMHAQSAITLDFEGSEIEGVAYFYKKFGSTSFPYMHIKKYNLF